MSDAIAEVPEYDYVLAGNHWTKTITFPATNSDGDPITYGTFAVSADDERTLTLESATNVDSTITVTLLMDDAAVGQFTWYITESLYFAGDAVLSGVVVVQAQT